MAGCGAKKQSALEKPVKKEKLESDEIKRDKALLHFIEGASLDAKGLYADAILEYQKALQAEPNAAIYYAISRDYAIRGDFESAIEEAKKAILMEPKSIKYRENLANIYLSASRVSSAIQVYEEIVEMDSSNENAWIMLANLYQITDPYKALEIYNKILETDDTQLDILFQCAQIYFSLGKLQEAEAKIKRMLELDPDNRMLQKNLIAIYIKGAKFDDAESLLRTIVERDSSDYDAIATLADVYLDQKKFQNAMHLYEYLLSKGVSNPEFKLRIGIGILGLAEKDSTLIEKAKVIFEDLKEQMENDWRPYWYLGAIAFNQHKYSDASLYFRKVINMESQNPDGWWYYAYTIFQQDKYDSVLQIIKTPQSLFEKDFRFYFLEGLALTRIEKQQEAVHPLEKAYELNPKDINVIGTLALTLDGLHKYDRSDSLYEEALRIDTNSAIILNNYSYSLAERGVQLEYALRMSEKAITAEPDNAAYLDTYGWILFKMGKFYESAQYIEKAIETGNATSVVYEHMGDVYFKIGYKEKAMQFWKKSLDMDPKNTLLKLKIDIEKSNE